MAAVALSNGLCESQSPEDEVPLADPVWRAKRKRKFDRASLFGVNGIDNQDFKRLAAVAASSGLEALFQPQAPQVTQDFLQVLLQQGVLNSSNLNNNGNGNASLALLQQQQLLSQLASSLGSSSVHVPTPVPMPPPPPPQPLSLNFQELAATALQSIAQSSAPVNLPFCEVNGGVSDKASALIALLQQQLQCSNNSNSSNLSQALPSLLSNSLLNASTNSNSALQPVLPNQQNNTDIEQKLLTVVRAFPHLLQNLNVDALVALLQSADKVSSSSTLPAAPAAPIPVASSSSSVPPPNLFINPSPPAPASPMQQLPDTSNLQAHLQVVFQRLQELTAQYQQQEQSWSDSSNSAMDTSPSHSDPQAALQEALARIKWAMSFQQQQSFQPVEPRGNSMQINQINNTQPASTCSSLAASANSTSAPMPPPPLPLSSAAMAAMSSASFMPPHQTQMVSAFNSIPSMATFTMDSNNISNRAPQTAASFPVMNSATAPMSFPGPATAGFSSVPVMISAPSSLLPPMPLTMPLPTPQLNAFMTGAVAPMAPVLPSAPTTAPMEVRNEFAVPHFPTAPMPVPWSVPTFSSPPPPQTHSPAAFAVPTPPTPPAPAAKAAPFTVSVSVSKPFPIHIPVPLRPRSSGAVPQQLQRNVK